MTEDYCEMCDLALSQCVHGRPPPPPPAPVKKAPAPRASPVRDAAGSRAASGVSTRRVQRKWTPPDEFRPHLLGLLRESGGRLDADDLMLELEIRLDGVLTPGDREKAPTGEERWHTAVRRQRKALIDEGLLVPAQPGVWELTPQGRTAG